MAYIQSARQLHGQGSATERRRGGGSNSLHLGLVSSDYICSTERAHLKHNPWTNSLAGIEPVPGPHVPGPRGRQSHLSAAAADPPVEEEFDTPPTAAAAAAAHRRTTWRARGYTSRDFFTEDSASQEPPAEPEVEVDESEMWLTGTLGGRPQPPAVARRRRVGRGAAAGGAAAGSGWEQRDDDDGNDRSLSRQWHQQTPRGVPPTGGGTSGVPAANGRRQGLLPSSLPSSGSSLGSDDSSGSSGSASSSSDTDGSSSSVSSSSLSSQAESRDLRRRVNKAVKIIRSVLQSWGGEGSMRETFQRVDTNRSGTIDAMELATFLRQKLHMNFDQNTISEIMTRFSDQQQEQQQEITYQSFCELVMGNAREQCEATAAKEKDDREDAERDAEMILRNRIRRSAATATGNNRNRLREIFDDVDRGGNGRLSYDDLRFALHVFGVVMPEAQFEKLVRKIDVNHDETITYVEFVNYFKLNNVDRELSYVRHVHGFSLEAAMRLIRETILQRCGATERAIARCFHVFDEDGSGEVDEQEFMIVLTKQLGLQFDRDLAHEIMCTLDTDGNGTIGMDEFDKYVMGMSSDAIHKAKRSYGNGNGNPRNPQRQHQALLT